MTRLQSAVGHAADMPQLCKDGLPLCVYRIGDQFPARDLFRGVDARCPGIALSAGFDLRALGNQEPRLCALRVIFGHQRVGDVPGLRAAAACQGWQEDPVFKGQIAQPHRIE